MLSSSFTLNLAMNIMSVRSPLHMRDFGRGAPDYAIFEMLMSGGVLVDIRLIVPLSRRCSLDTLIHSGRRVLALGTAGFLWSPVIVCWRASAMFGLGLSVFKVAAVIRSQQAVPVEIRGRVLGALMALNAPGLSLGVVLASWPIATGVLMAGLTGMLVLLALLWTYTVRNIQGPLQGGATPDNVL